MMTMMAIVALGGVGILLAAGGATLLLGKASASLRHLVWTAAFAVLVAIPVLEASAGSDLPLALGPEATWWSGPRLELAPLRASARIPAGTPVDCASDHRLPSSRAGKPHLRVWYVAPASRVAEEGAIDESLRARPRALGYEW